MDELRTWGELRMSIGDFANAAQTYAELVDLVPESAPFRLRLAIAMARWPPTSKRAEREFHEALRLDPNSVDVNFQLGLYYKGMKLRARAVERFRTVLVVDPEHARARTELEALSPRDSALVSLKKLFR